MADVEKFGSDVALVPRNSYIGVVRDGKKFAIVQPSSERLDVGIKLRGVEPTGRLTAAGSWNTMVTHRVRVDDPKQVDAELIGWLKQAYSKT